MALGLFRRRPAAAGTITIAVDRAVVAPGDTLTAHVLFRAEREIADAECAVSLAHRSVMGGRDTVLGDGWAVAGRYVLDEDRVPAGSTYEWTVALPVPRRTTPPAGPQDCADERYPPSGADAVVGSYDAEIEPDERWGPPTSTGAGLRVEWVVRCEIRGAGVAAEAEEPVVVLAPERPAAMLAVRHRTGTDDAAIAFADLPARSVPAGAAVHGRIRLRAQREIDARALRVDLVRWVHTDREDAWSTWEVLDSTEVAGPTTLRPRVPVEHRFTLTVPATAPPSIEVEGFRAEYLLRAVVDRPRREDVVADQVLLVHGPPG